MTPPPTQAASAAPLPAGLTRAQLLELYYWMRLTRSLEERLVSLHRQGKVIGGLFRSLGQEADSVGSAYALDREKGDILSPLIRNLGSMLVQGATPIEVLDAGYHNANERIHVDDLLLSTRFHIDLARRILS